MTEVVLDREFAGVFTANGLLYYQTANDANLILLNAAVDIVSNANGTLIGEPNNASISIQSNIGSPLIVSANTDSNTIFLHVRTASTTQNGVITLSDVVTANGQNAATENVANFLYGLVRTANLRAFGAFLQANSAWDHANSAFAQANTGVTATAPWATANSAWSHANSAFGQANTANSSSGLGYIWANSAYSKTNGAFAQANSGWAVANTGNLRAFGAFAQANSAFAAANGKVSSTGNGTIMGSLFLQGSGNVIFRIFADDDNDGESDLPTIVMLSDGGISGANLGMTSTNDFEITVKGGNSIYLGNVEDGRFMGLHPNGFISMGGAIINGVDILTHANNAYTQANTGNTRAFGAFAQANGAWSTANTADSRAIGAFAQANGAWSSTNTANAYTVSILPQLEYSNFLINGMFRHAQRGLIFNPISDDTYSLDRWYTLTQSNPIKVERTTNPYNGAPYAISITQINASSQRFGLAQILEGDDSIVHRGKTLIFGGQFRTTRETATIRPFIVEWTGTKDAVTSDIVNSWTSTIFTINNFFINSTLDPSTTTNHVQDAANTWQSFSITKTISSSANNIMVFVYWANTVEQDQNIEFANMYLIEGVIAPLYVHPRPFALEQSICDRFFQKADVYVPATTAQNIRTIRMRAVPTITGGGAGFTSTGTTANSIIAFQTAAAVQTLSLDAEL
jgi:hypothetical protein